AGADLITIQAENGPLVPAALDLARKSNVGTGIALGLDTLPETIEPLLDMLDMVLMMGTPLGIKGVQPSPFAFRRIERMKELILRNGLETKVKIF
ncbi:MAG TPA: ribulose phosphate epimerase, partial [Firmicutes bacterium]|nr:ribulose phosphate epimerase [Bacillota bacterium]